MRVCRRESFETSDVKCESSRLAVTIIMVADYQCPWRGLELLWDAGTGFC